jgi:hypothetical protein
MIQIIRLNRKNIRFFQRIDMSNIWFYLRLYPTLSFRKDNMCIKGIKINGK